MQYSFESRRSKLKSIQRRQGVNKFYIIQYIDFIFCFIPEIYLVQSENYWNIRNISEKCSDGRNSESENRQIESEDDLFNTEEIESDYWYRV